MRFVLGIALAIVANVLAISTWPTKVAAQKRVALVIGNDKYDNLGPQQQLQRAVNDARSVSAALASLGFEVIAGENANRAAFNAQWQTFLDKIAPGDTAAIYFSGHGVEIEGLNFLLPRDVPNISYGRQEQIKRESLSVSELLLDLRTRKPKVSLVILDACRDHPLIPPEYRSAGKAGGLARMDASEGTFIMYSAGAGETALDRLPGNDPDKTNSVYTRKLLPLLKAPGLPLHELARQLRSEVSDLVTPIPHVQRPAYYDGLLGKFCMAGCDVVSGMAQRAVNEATEAWDRAKDVANIAALEAFAARYKGTSYADMARAKIEELRKQAATALPPAPPVRPTTPPVKSAPVRNCDGVEVLIGNNDERRCLRPKEAFKDCSNCPEMVIIPAGEFVMGSEDGIDDEKPAHKVAFTRPFAVSKFEIKYGEWQACVSDQGGCQHYPVGTGDNTLPVTGVSWEDINKEYLRWLGRRAGKPYRLLTEAEWEYSARAGSASKYSWGPEAGRGRANCNGCGSRWDGKSISSVGSFPPNAFGLFDVHGNVWEWVQDCYGAGYAGASFDGTAAPDAAGCSRVVRGGSWQKDASFSTVTRRSKYTPDYREVDVGFRVARTID